LQLMTAADCDCAPHLLKVSQVPPAPDRPIPSARMLVLTTASSRPLPHQVPPAPDRPLPSARIPRVLRGHLP